MKKITVKLNPNHALGLSQYLDALEVAPSMPNSEKCALALVKKWNSEKLKPKLDYLDDSMKLSMSAPLAFAFLTVFEDVPLPPTHYLGNRILQITNDIDRAFK